MSSPPRLHNCHAAEQPICSLISLVQYAFKSPYSSYHEVEGSSVISNTHLLIPCGLQGALTAAASCSTLIASYAQSTAQAVLGVIQPSDTSRTWSSYRVCLHLWTTDINSALLSLQMPAASLHLENSAQLYKSGLT